MIRVPIVPNGNVILSPLETNLDIMIVGQQVQEVVQQDLALAFCNIVDMSDVMTNSEYRFPPSDGIRANNLFVNTIVRDSIPGGLLPELRQHSLELHEGQCATQNHVVLHSSGNLVANTSQSSHLQISSTGKINDHISRTPMPIEYRPRLAGGYAKSRWSNQQG